MVATDVLPDLGLGPSRNRAAAGVQVTTSHPTPEQLAYLEAALRHERTLRALARLFPWILFAAMLTLVGGYLIGLAVSYGL